MPTSIQIKKIHAFKSLLKLGDMEYLNRLRPYRVFTSKDLTETQANVLIYHLQEEAIAAGVYVRRQAAYQNLYGRPGMASPKQLRMIEAMWADVSRAGTYAARANALKQFLHRFGVYGGLKAVTIYQARKIVTALQTMKENNHESI